ncbi:MAG: hypothetical protein M1824_003197 [Vezdaea acicularis]|nr:MAG: hypothetical protein M1824_003197 [Vezdaea acicularis]
MAPLPAAVTSSLSQGLSGALNLIPRSLSDLADTAEARDFRLSFDLSPRSHIFGDLDSAVPGKISKLKNRIYNDFCNVVVPKVVAALIPRSTPPTAALSPSAVNLIARSKDAAPTVNHGAGSINPTKVNNKGMLGLFGLLFAALILLAIWFFFWAKNGGFIYREGDWEEYKSTVLRRKTVDGKTLSNATKSTKLGQSSVSGEYDAHDMVHHEVGRDNDVREYRHEKPARVGGINRKPDGSYYDHTNTDRSEIMTEKAPPSKAPTKKSGGWFSRAKKVEKKKAPAPRQPSTTYSFTEGDDSTVAGSEDRRPLRSSPRHARYGEGRSRHHSPSRHSRHSHPLREEYTEYGSEAGTNPYEDTYTDNSGDLGTKSYRHVIPGLSAGTRTELAETRPSRARGGFRRGGGGRRDSLSDSEGETQR